MNNYQGQKVVFGQSFADTVAKVFGSSSSVPLVASPKVRLSHDPAFNPTPQSTIASLAANECTFSGYPTGGDTATVSGALNLSTACVGAQLSVLFTGSSTTTFNPDTCYGYWVDDGTNLIVGEKFAGGASQGFAQNGDFLDLLVFLPIQLNQATT